MHPVSGFVRAVEPDRRALLSPAFPQLLQLGKAAGGQLDFPAFACSKLDALDLDRQRARKLSAELDERMLAYAFLPPVKAAPTGVLVEWDTADETHDDPGAYDMGPSIEECEADYGILVAPLFNATEAVLQDGCVLGYITWYGFIGVDELHLRAAQDAYWEPLDALEVE